MVLVLLPVPLVLWPVIGIGGSLLGGFGYGFFAPLLATFEVAGENVSDKFYHCFAVSFSLSWHCLCFTASIVLDEIDACFCAASPRTRSSSVLFFELPSHK